MQKLEIEIKPQMQYLVEQSAPENFNFLWSYDIIITNNSNEIVQLLHRYWRITDMTGKVEEVRGPGVVGLQPLIKPGKQFAYSSFCHLTTPKGSMEGNYEMQTLAEERFRVEIPKFDLISPSSAANFFRISLH